NALRIACWYCASAARSRACAAAVCASRSPPAKIGCATAAATAPSPAPLLNRLASAALSLPSAAVSAIDGNISVRATATLALAAARLRAHRRRLGLELAQIEIRDHAGVIAPALQAERLFAQQHRAARELDLLVERAQREIGFRHLRGQREAYRLARGFVRGELGPRGLRAGAQAPEEVDFVGQVERRPIVAVLARNAGKEGRGARREL